MAKLEPKVTPKIGVMYTGLKAYWPQFPEFLDIGAKMLERYMKQFEQVGEVVLEKFVDTPERAAEAGKRFVEEGDRYSLYPAFRLYNGHDYRACGSGALPRDTGAAPRHA